MKRGQIELSFGMLFSIIIIIATIAIAFYFLRVFFQTSSCTSFELLHADIRDRIKDVWRSPQAQEKIVLTVPQAITAVCFGVPDVRHAIGEKLDAYRVQGQGVYLYPPQEACQGSLAAKRIEHSAPSPAWFCTNVSKGKAQVTFLKEGPTQAEVRITL